MESPHDLFRQTLAAIWDRIAAIRSIRERFGLDPRQAKEVLLRVEGAASSLDEYEERVAVGMDAVWRWRKALGVGATAAGTSRLRSDCTREPWAVEAGAA